MKNKLFADISTETIMKIRNVFLFFFNGLSFLFPANAAKGICCFAVLVRKHIAYRWFDSEKNAC